MKNLFKSKRTLLGLGLALVALITIGLTFAWFTGTSQIDGGTVEMGSFGIESKFDLDDNEGIYYEPGIYVEAVAEVSNTGTLAFFAELEINAQSTLVRENGSNMIIPNDENVGIEIPEEQLGYKNLFDAQGEYLGSYAWYEHRGTGNYYLFVDEGISAEMLLEVIFDGPGMGNEYMNAKIDIKGQWRAAQALEGAIADTFEVDWDDLDMVNRDLTDYSRMGARAAAGAPVTGRQLHERIDSLVTR